MSRQFSTTLWTLAAAIIVLSIANASPTSGWAGDTSMLLLAVTFVASMIAISLASANDRMQLSLQVMAIYFSIYLLLPGYNHASVNVFPFYNFSYSPEVRTSAALIILVFMISVAVGYLVTSKQILIRGVSKASGPCYVMDINGKLALLITIISIVSVILFLRAVGISNALSTREVLDDVANDIDGSGLLVTMPRVFAYLPVIYGILILKYSKRSGMAALLLAINVPIFLIVNFPLSLPRSQVFGAALLFCSLFIDFKRTRNRLILSIAYVFGALVAMPFLNHFSRMGGTFETLDVKQLVSSYFGSGDFDGYQSISNAVVYVERYGVENGLQIISALLFFVPRSIWASKGLPTGAITSEAAGYKFNNVSQPLPSEFYVDFGWSGVVVGGLLLGYVFCRVDNWIDRGWINDLRTRLVAGWLMGFSLFIFRGTLLGVLPPILIIGIGLWVISRWGMRPVDIDN